MFDKLVIVTKKTPLEELIERFNSKPQAKFYIEHSGASFKEYEDAHNTYYQSLEQLKQYLPGTIRQHFIERAFLPNFQFGDNDLVIVIGPDGLVINTAKYLKNQPILAVNPDVSRIDGVLLPFSISSLKSNLIKILHGKYSLSEISMAQIQLNDGQELYGVNDIFIGPKSQLSFRYNIKFGGKEENQCSSGIIISTGAGSTAWLRSVIIGARAITAAFDKVNIKVKKKSDFEWNSDQLMFCVREPFPSNTSETEIVFGRITKNNPLYLTSQTPQGAVAFSDGIENDYLEFNSGKIAKVCLADKKAQLLQK